ncbi:MAG: SDR family NAD(P)-dependent oxidoreductase [Acidimicrobiales bacterium]
MKDATGMPQSVVLLGGTSEIGLAIVGELAKRRLEKLVLAGRDQTSLESAREALGLSEDTDIALEICDVTRGPDIADLVKRCRQILGTVDLLVVAAGDLGSSELDELKPERVLELFATNVGGPAGAMIAFASLMAEQGSGHIVVLSSVAGLRVRRANFVYGAGKAALDGLSLGLGDAVRQAGVSLTIVRPGFVRTRMTAGLPEAPFSTDPETVALEVIKALERGTSVVYVPALLGPLFGVLRIVPRAIFRRLTK